MCVHGIFLFTRRPSTSPAIVLSLDACVHITKPVLRWLCARMSCNWILRVPQTTRRDSTDPNLLAKKRWTAGRNLMNEIRSTSFEWTSRFWRRGGFVTQRRLSTETYNRVDVNHAESYWVDAASKDVCSRPGRSKRRVFKAQSTCDLPFGAHVKGFVRLYGDYTWEKSESSTQPLQSRHCGNQI